MKKPIIDAEYRVVGETPPPLKWWQGWRIGYDPSVIAPTLIMTVVLLLGR